MMQDLRIAEIVAHGLEQVKPAASTTHHRAAALQPESCETLPLGSSLNRGFAVVHHWSGGHNPATPGPIPLRTNHGRGCSSPQHRGQTHANIGKLKAVRLAVSPSLGVWVDDEPWQAGLFTATRSAGDGAGWSWDGCERQQRLHPCLLPRSSRQE